MPSRRPPARAMQPRGQVTRDETRAAAAAAASSPVLQRGVQPRRGGCSQAGRQRLCQGAGQICPHPPAFGSPLNFVSIAQAGMPCLEVCLRSLPAIVSRSGWVSSSFCLNSSLLYLHSIRGEQQHMGYADASTQQAQQGMVVHSTHSAPVHEAGIISGAHGVRADQDARTVIRQGVDGHNLRVKIGKDQNSE